MLPLISCAFKKVFGYFIAGLLAILPFALTAAIVAWVAGFLKSIMGPGTLAGRVLAGIGVRLGSDGLVSYILGLLLVVAAIFVLGLLVEWGAKQFYHNTLDWLFARVPLVGSLYGSLKQLVAMFDQPKEAKLKSMSVVFCYFGAPGSAGVLALMPSTEKIAIDGEDFHVVMIPTAPIPFGGALNFVPARLVKPVAMSVDHFVSVYVSMGVTTPEFMKQLSVAANTN